MRTSNVNVLLNQGADFDVLFLVPGTTAPVNLIGYSFQGQIREDSGGPVVASFVFAVLDQTISDNTGKVRWTLSKEDTLLLQTTNANAEASCRGVTPYLYDVLMTDSLGAVSRILQGKVLVSPAITQESSL